MVPKAKEAAVAEKAAAAAVDSAEKGHRMADNPGAVVAQAATATKSADSGIQVPGKAVPGDKEAALRADGLGPVLILVHAEFA